MGCYQDALSNIMPVDWLDPYGRTPFAKDAELSVDITIVETQDGIRASSVKNPPTSGSSRLMDAIKGALGMACPEIGPQNGSQRSDDLGKQDEEKDRENMAISDTESGKSGTMKPSSSGSSRDRDRNPGSQGSRRRTVEDPGLNQGNQVGEGAKEKAPKF